MRDDFNLYMRQLKSNGKESIKRMSKFFGDIFEPNESKRDKTIEMICEKHYQKMIDEVISLEDELIEEKYLLIDGETEIGD